MRDQNEGELALAGLQVSRETLAALHILATELARWQSKLNLIGPRSLDQLWTRHIADSLQLLEHSGDGEWVDLGSGAGFPGLVIAASANCPRVTLIESDSRKCAFLRHAARAMGVTAHVIESRIERAEPPATDGGRIVTARALAPLNTLLTLASPWITEGSVGLFPKGRGYERELTQAAESWRFEAELLPSRTDPAARIIRVTHLASR